MASPQEPVRVDVWIWAVRLVKTRAVAATACRGGHVRVNDVRAKPAQQVRPGDEVRVRHAGREKVVRVTQTLRKRVGAPQAVACYEDLTPAPPPRPEQPALPRREPGAGRPTKRERRQLDRLRRR